MLGASSSEEEDDDYHRGSKSDRDDVSVVFSVAPDRTDRKTSYRSVSPSQDSNDRLSYSGSVRTPSVAGIHGSFPSGAGSGSATPHTQHHPPVQPSVSQSHGGGHRPPSPSPSERSESGGSEKLPPPEPKLSKAEQEALQAVREEEEHKTKIQLYVFVAKCIAYHFNAKQPTDMARRQTKITKQEMGKIKERFQGFLKGETDIAADEAFINAVQSYFEVFLRSERVQVPIQSIKNKYIL